MKLLKNRKFAVVLTVAIAIIATLFGVHKSLNRLAGDVEALFYNGIYNEKEGYTEPSIDSQLKKQSDAVLGFVTIARNYPQLEAQAEKLRLARAALLDAGSIKDKAAANSQMLSAFNGCTDIIATLDALSARDKDALDSYSKTFSGAAGVIDTSKAQYNVEVAGFLDGRSYSNLAHMLRPLAFVTPPEPFVNN